MKARILVVDDDPLLRAAVARILVVADYDVTEAADGVEGLQKYQNGKFDLVITDILMPNKDGAELIDELCQIDSDVKIIVVSGADRDGNQVYLNVVESLGSEKVLAKPFQRGELLDRIDSMLYD